MDNAWFEVNRAYWDDRVATHVEGWSPLRPFEVAEAGDVAGLDLVHLQCHFGMDTLGWARVGARVVGVDLSAPATLRGRTLDRRAGSYADPDATFEHNDTVEWNHGIGAVVTALADVGLRIESLVERPTLFMQPWPFQVGARPSGLAQPT